MSEPQKDRLQIGKVITLETAAKRLAEVDGGYCDLRWALRFCLDSAVRVCIRLRNPIHTWEGERDIGKSCGKCVEISDERQRLALEDANEDEKPQYCQNCHMTKPPMMDSTRYLEQRIGERWGTFFLSRGFLQALCEPSIDTFNCGTFFQLDSEDATGYASFEVASDYDCEFHSGYDCEFYNAELLHSDLSKQDFLIIGLKDLFVWVEDFEAALKGDSTEARQELPMNQTKNVKKWIGEYAAANGLVKDVPLSDDQLRAFRGASSSAGIAPTTFDTCRRIEGFIGKDRAKKI
jgi:hypothetical protein